MRNWRAKLDFQRIPAISARCSRGGSVIPPISTLSPNARFWDSLLKNTSCSPTEPISAMPPTLNVGGLIATSSVISTRYYALPVYAFATSRSSAFAASRQ